MKPSKIIESTKNNTQPSIKSFFKTKNNNKQNILIKHAQLNDTEISFNYTNTINNELKYDKHHTTIAPNHITQKKISKTASLIGRLKTTTSLFIKKLKDKKRKRKKQERVKQLLKKESKSNIQSTRHAYSTHHSDLSYKALSDNSSSYYPLPTTPSTLLAIPTQTINTKQSPRQNVSRVIYHIPPT